jgi:FlaA1/EpsC-like NDP-sugar epimerase
MSHPSPAERARESRTARASLFVAFYRIAYGAWARLRGASLRRATGDRDNRPAVIVYGAGTSGAGVSVTLQEGGRHRVIGFVDDDPRLGGSLVRSLPVHPPSALPWLAERHPSAIVVLAMPSATTAERRRVLERLRPHGFRIRSVPGLRELMLGEARYDEIREVAVEDLLGRESVPPDRHLLSSCISGRSVLVTGAGGSIGSELCRQIVRLQPSRLVLLELSEFALYRIREELAELARADVSIARVPVVPMLGSVCSDVLVEELLRGHGVQTVYHAAACKHVGIVEGNEVVGIATNTFGTLTIARAAARARVGTFVLVSTDKAVRPTSVMGASKRLAELVVADLAAGGWTSVGASPPGAIMPRGSSLECPTRFVTVRFGNVLGSSGSVVPKFLRQIAEGGPLTVTHPEATRYFMTIAEAVNLVIQAGSLGRGGDVLLLDMGEPVRILDLARNLAALHGLSIRNADSPMGELEVDFVGLQPGEKLHEELFETAGAERTEHARILRVLAPGLGGPRLARLLTALEAACDRHDGLRVRELLRSFVRAEGSDATPRAQEA